VPELFKKWNTAELKSTKLEILGMHVADDSREVRGGGTLFFTPSPSCRAPSGVLRETVAGECMRWSLFKIARRDNTIIAVKLS